MAALTRPLANLSLAGNAVAKQRSHGPLQSDLLGSPVLSSSSPAAPVQAGCEGMVKISSRVQTGPVTARASLTSKKSSRATSSSARRSVVAQSGKRMFDDPFDYGEDPDLEYGDLLSSGKQDAVDPRPPTDTSSDAGWLKFPPGHNPEIASLGLYIRDDVRSCAILVAGGVYENLLFFPVISLLKEKYPGVKIDVAAPPRGKQTYEINKNVRRAWVYDPEDPFVTPAEYTEFLGKLKNEVYDLVLSTRLAGLGHAMFLFLSDARQRVSYVNPNASGAGAGVFLSNAVRTEKENLAEDGYAMYKDLIEFLLQPVRGGPALYLPPLQVNIPRKVKDVTRGKTAAAGVAPGAYTLVHGVESSSAASMRSRGDADSALSLGLLAEIAKSVSGDLLVVVPNDADQDKVQGAVPSAKVVKITTPGQLAAAIDDAAAVVTTNTAAVQLATALRKPSVALFGSSDKAALFVPDAADRKCTVVASASGSLAGISAKDVAAAIASLPVSAAAQVAA
ncbi:hypothetical protein CLOM_g4778 [Closterium sp. NIES-68]|nr:hypothetical protein CLOM_g4778 [Closterium sp. NIES-68]